MTRTTLFALALLPLAACGPVPLSATLPPDAVRGAADPTRAAITSTAYAFNNPGGLAGPGVAARAAANLEFLAAAVPWDARYSFTPTLAGQLALARGEMHGALGVAADASPQAVVDGLYGVWRAGDAGAAERALSPAVFPDRRATLLRLASMGPLPASAVATAQAEREMLRSEQDRQNDNSGGAGGRD